MPEIKERCSCGGVVVRSMPNDEKAICKECGEEYLIRNLGGDKIIVSVNNNPDPYFRELSPSKIECTYTVSEPPSGAYSGTYVTISIDNSKNEIREIEVSGGVGSGTKIGRANIGIFADLIESIRNRVVSEDKAKTTKNKLEEEGGEHATI